MSPPVAAASLAPVVFALAQSANAAVTVVARLAGLALLAGLLAAVVALGYRWYVRERVPAGLALLVALAGVAIVLNTTRLLAAEITAGDAPLEVVDALFNIAAFVGAAAGAYGGARAGDRVGADLVATGTGSVDADVSEVVQSVGRVTTVQLPEEIDDIVGYDPVSAATKETLAGRRFLFPRRLTKAELRERLVARLKTDYGVGHVDVELGDDGAVTYLAVGSRAAGIGPTLPPATNAVAVRADPAHAASAGDLVQVWETDPQRRVLTGELRGVAGDVVTVAIDAADTPKLDPTREYKLVTLPVEDRPDREFASLLRAADETLATVTVEAGSDLVGATVASLPVTVAAITRDDDAPDPLPAGSRTLRAGDCLYAIATPELLRKVEAAAVGTGEDADAAASEGPDETVADAGGDGDAASAEGGEAATGDSVGGAEGGDGNGGPEVDDAGPAAGSDDGSDAIDADATTATGGSDAEDADGDAAGDVAADEVEDGDDAAGGAGADGDVGDANEGADDAAGDAPGDAPDADAADDTTVRDGSN